MHELVALIIYTFAAFGFCWGVGHSKPTLPLRNWLAKGAESRYLAVALITHAVLLLMECPACLGTWLGLAIGHFAPPVAIPHAALYFAFYTMGINFVLGVLTKLIVEE